MKSKLFRRTASALLFSTILLAAAALPARADGITLSPSALGQGASAVSVTVHGVGTLALGVSGVDVSGGGVTTENPQYQALAGTATFDATVDPGAAVGARNVTVHTGSGDLTCSACLTINAAPHVTGIDPSALEEGSNDVPVTFSGTGFASGLSVHISGTGVTVGAPSALTPTSVTVPVTLTKTAPVSTQSISVQNGDGGTWTCSGCFSILQRKPHPTAIDPASVSRGANAFDITLTGTNFDNGATAVVSGTGVSVSGTDVASPTQMTATITVAPDAALGLRSITVTNPDGGSNPCTECLTIIPPPTASSFTPAQRGQGTANQSIAIAGVGLTPGTTAVFSGSGIHVNSTSYDAATSRLMVNVDVASNAVTGARDVTLTNLDGTHTTCAGCFAVTPPTHATLAGPAVVGGVFVATFDQNVQNLTANNLYVRVAGTSTNISSSITCKTGAGALTSCAGNTIRQAILQPKAPLIAGQAYTASTDSVVDWGGLPVDPQSVDFRSTSEQAESTAGETFVWRTVKTSSAYGGSYVVEHLAGARASFRFTGSSITWWTNTGPDYGVAYVYVDNVYKGSVNLYSSTLQYRRGFNVGRFPNGVHTLSIVVHGTKSSASKGTKVAVDAFSIGYNQYSTPALTYTWRVATSSAASGGKYVWADYAGASSTFTFKGTSISWYSILGSGMGKANVYIDGVLKGTYDNYSSSAHYGFRRTWGGLADKVHTIKIVVLGTHRAASSGSYVAIDRWIVA